MTRKIFFFVIFSFMGAFTYAAIADLAVTEVWPSVEKTGNYVSPKVVIKNVGGDLSSSPSISVTVVIKDDSGTEIYSETFSGSYSLLSNYGDSVVLTFPVKQITTAGTYTVAADLTYADDQNSSNNTLSTNLIVRDFTYPEGYIYGYNVAPGDYQGHLVAINLNDHTLPVTDLGVSGVQYTAGDYFRGVVQIIKTGTHEIYWLDKDGNTYFYGKLRGVTGSIYGFTYTQGVIYVMSFEDATSQTHFYKVDTATLMAYSPAPLSSETMGGMGFAADDNGKVYVIDYYPPDVNGNYLPGNLYNMGTIAGTLTKLGTLNKIFYGLADYSVERTTGDLYGAVAEYDENGSPQGYYVVKINTSTAVVEELYNRNTNLQLGFVALIPGVSLEPTAIGDNTYAFYIYPNPSSGIVNITDLQGARLTVSDMTGKIVLQKQIKSSNEQIDLSFLRKGIYLIKAEQNNKAFVKKIILK